MRSYCSTYKNENLNNFFKVKTINLLPLKAKSINLLSLKFTFWLISTFVES